MRIIIIQGNWCRLYIDCQTFIHSFTSPLRDICVKSKSVMYVWTIVQWKPQHMLLKRNRWLTSSMPMSSSLLMRSWKNSVMSFCSPVFRGWWFMVYTLQKLRGLYAFRSLSCTHTTSQGYTVNNSTLTSALIMNRLLNILNYHAVCCFSKIHEFQIRTV